DGPRGCGSVERRAWMNFFGMGPMEILVIMVIALMIFGPGKLPEIAQGIGKDIREFRAATSDLTGEFQRTLNEVTSGVTPVVDEVRQSDADVRRCATSARTEATRWDQSDTPTRPRGGSGLFAKAVAEAKAAAPQRLPTKGDPLANPMPIDAPPGVASNG